MQISWGNASNAVGDSALTLAITGFNLADWKPFVGEVAPAGMVNMTAKVLSQQGGKQVTLGFDSRIEHLTVNAGSNHISDATITLHGAGKATDLKQFSFTDYKLEVAHQNETLTTRYRLRHLRPGDRDGGHAGRRLRRRWRRCCGRCRSRT